MYDELVKRLRELQAITEHCDEQSCDECENRELCDKHDNKTLSGTYKDAADAIENLSQPRWISVTERLPEDRQSVLVHRDDGGIFIFEYFTTSPTDECWIDDHLNVYSAYCVTHWMSLPQPPKEET